MVWTKQQKPTKGQLGTVYAVTKKLVCVEVDGTKERVGKHSNNVQLVAIAKGKEVVYRPQAYGKEWEIVKRRCWNMILSRHFR